MFRSDAAKLTFEPADGMLLLATGKVSVYARDGQYQLICKTLAMDGEGTLTMAFEQLKKKLEDEGLFDPRHKKPLPAFPQRIALVTSGSGAAVRDMIRILGRRWPLCEVVVVPVHVQGDEAPDEIVAAIRCCNRNNVADVIITGRGGGSIEDLWAFNDERVARAIFASAIPVVSAVGHEPDVTIADFVADIRASTPSHAAEIVVPDCDEFYARLGQLRKRVSHDRYFNDKSQQIDRVSERLRNAMERSITFKSNALSTLKARTEALNPMGVLARGYSVVQKADGLPIRSVNDISLGDKLKIRLKDGLVESQVTGIGDDSVV
jgi:exodeoxyribonuclease VII large subunit